MSKPKRSKIGYQNPRSKQNKNATKKSHLWSKGTEKIEITLIPDRMDLNRKCFDKVSLIMGLGREGGQIPTLSSQQNLAAKTSYKYAVNFQKCDNDQKYVNF